MANNFQMWNINYNLIHENLYTEKYSIANKSD